MTIHNKNFEKKIIQSFFSSKSTYFYNIGESNFKVFGRNTMILPQFHNFSRLGMQFRILLHCCICDSTSLLNEYKVNKAVAFNGARWPCMKIST